MKFTITGKSLNELYQEYGQGLGGFYSQWWEKRSFADEKPEAGIYELDLSDKLKNLTLDEQKAKLEKGCEVAHPAIVAEAILSHYKKTSERLCKDYCLRTKSVDSDSSWVNVGLFDSDGLDVNYYWGDYRYGSGVSSARKLKSLKSEPLSLESRILKLEKFKESVEKVLKI